MFSYQTREIVYRFKRTPSFPATGTVNFYINPDQPFCVNLDGKGRTAFAGTEWGILLNMNNGKASISAPDPPDPLSGTFVGDSGSLDVVGNVLTLSRSFDSSEELHNTIEHFVRIYGPSGIIVGRDRVLRSRRGWRS
jgi:hypothetical protein